MAPLQTLVFLSSFRVLTPADNLSVLYLAFLSYGEIE